MAKSTGIQAAANLLTKLASLLFYIVLARELGRAGFGDFTLAAALAVIFVAPGAFGMDYIITREVARDHTVSDEVIWHATAIKVAFGALGMALAIGFAVVTGYDGSTFVPIILMCTATLVEILTGSLHASFRGREDFGPAAVSLVIQRLTTAVIGVPLLLTGAGLLVACSVYLAGSLLGLVWMLSVMGRRRLLSAPRFARGRARWLLVASLPIGLNELFGVVLNRVDIGILALLATSTAVGVYGAAYRLFETTLFLSQSLGLAALPAFSVLSRDSTPSLATALTLALKATALVLFPIGAILAVFAPYLVGSLYGSTYAGAVPAVRWLSLAVALYGFFILPSLVLVTVEKGRSLASVSVLGLIANIALNLLLIPPLGVTGAALAMAASQAFLSAAMYMVARRAAGSLPLRRIAAGPLIAALPIGIIGLTAGQHSWAVVSAALAYVLVLLSAEHVLNPGDLYRVRQLILRRSPVA